MKYYVIYNKPEKLLDLNEPKFRGSIPECIDYIRKLAKEAYNKCDYTQEQLNNMIMTIQEQLIIIDESSIKNVHRKMPIDIYSYGILGLDCLSADEIEMILGK
jgi:hypothetical protein